MEITEDNYLAHYGILRKSGRYPWGSGGNAESRSRDFLGLVAHLRSEGMSDPEIARGFGMTTTELRAVNTIANNAQKQHLIDTAQKLKDKGLSNVAIGEKIGKNESVVRDLLAPGAKEKADALTATSRMLREQVDEKGVIQIGSGVENHLGVSDTRLKVAVAMLKEEGYEVHNVQVPQLGTGAGNKSTIKVLAKPGTTYKDIASDLSKIRMINETTTDNGKNWSGIQTPISIDSGRVRIKYHEDGGSEADGMIYIRPGVPELSMGNARYTQTRIAIDGTHYLKGMAVYKDDLPKGVDIEFHTAKSSTGNKHDAMKKLNTDDPMFPFGAMVRQHKDAEGKVKSAINIVNEEGNWDKWKKRISTQVLSKQDHNLAKNQLDLTYDRKKNELDDIMKLTNPAVRKTLLDAYADSADSSAVTMHAVGLPRQRTQVIIPANTLKDNEVYAPNFKNGESVVLIRYPHGGKFEIPELKVNNSNPEAKSLLSRGDRGAATDAIAINHRVASKLSGADYDGDTVLVIPQGKGRKIATEGSLSGLKDFNPQRSYPAYPGMKVMDARTKQTEMGLVSNLITDMTIGGANNAELARAVRHSMVVIDAEKHKLDYKQSAIDNGITQLYQKYQGNSRGGAATLISRATARVEVPHRKRTFKVDPETGEKIYTYTGETYPVTKTSKRTGVTTTKMVPRTTRSVKLAEAKDARTLISTANTPIEKVYADHSNKLKALANQARKESVNTKPVTYSPSAAKVYEKEVKSLTGKLNEALKNRPLERQAQVIANTIVDAKVRSNPSLREDKAELKKIRNAALQTARDRTGAKKAQIVFEGKEWEAVQAGAISNNRLTTILKNTDLDKVKELATPRQNTVMTSAKQRRAQAMLGSGYTQAEVAEALGVPLGTLKSFIALP